jgi:tetrahydromethanopterin S-methyltransferase subunit A
LIYILPSDCEVKGHCMCKELLVIPVNRVVDKKRIIGTKWRAEE